MHLDRRWGFDARPDETIEIVRTIRKEVGDRIGILVDVNNAYSLPTAVRVGRALQDLGVSHFEEPLAAYDYQGYAQLQAALEMPIAAGEQEYTRWQYMDLINTAKVDILQPDVIKTGGFTESCKIADLAQMYGKQIVTHNAYPTVNTVAQMHYWAANQACYPRQEYVTEPHPLRDEYPLFPNLPVPLNGKIEIPGGPGLGLELDEKLFKKCEDITIDTPIIHH
jgi:L-alanine-DL-glutamate epimerase-like enolase superfamily enzyme